MLGGYNTYKFYLITSEGHTHRKFKHTHIDWGTAMGIAQANLLKDARESYNKIPLEMQTSFRLEENLGDIDVTSILVFENDDRKPCVAFVLEVGKVSRYDKELKRRVTMDGFVAKKIEEPDWETLDDLE